MKYPLIVALLMANLCNAQQPNILLVIADDMGLDPVPGYLPGPTKAAMPNLEALMANGLTFDNAWADPLCSPTRATILTGRYGLYTGCLLYTSEVIAAQQRAKLRTSIDPSMGGSQHRASAAQPHRGFSTAQGTSISSSEMPPCWKVCMK